MTSSGRPYGRLIRICGALAAGAGVVALLGWSLGLPVLASLGAGRIPMAPSSALLFVLYGLATFLRARLPLRRDAYWLGVAVCGAGALVAVLLFFLSYQGIYLEAERLGFAAVDTVGGARTGHMSPATALGFLLASLSFLASLPSFSNRPWRAAMAWGSAGLLLAASAVLLLAYLYGTPLLYGSSFIPPAATTGLAFAALAVALAALAAPQAWPHGERARVDARPAPVLLMVFVLLATGVITSGYLASRSYEVSYRGEVERGLSAVAELKVSELVQYRKERFGDASIFLQNAAIAALVQRMFDNPADGEARAQLRTWLGNVQTHYQYDRLDLLDAHGAVRMGLPEPVKPIGSVVARRAAEVLRSRETILQDFYRDEHDQRIYLTMLVPILGEPGGSRALGVIALRIDPESRLYPFITRWPTPSPTAETLIIRRDGNDALFLNELRFEKNTALTVRIPLERQDVLAVKAVLGHEGIVEGVDYRGVAVIGDVRAVPDSPWFLVARMDASEVYGPLRGRMWMTVVLVGALLSGAGAGVGAVSRQQHVRFYRQQYETELALRENERRFGLIAETVTEAFWIADVATGQMSYISPAYERVWGRSVQSLYEKPRSFIEAIHPDDVARVLANLELEKSGQFFEHEYRIRRPDGTERWIWDRGFPVHEPTGEVLRYVGVAQDITERKQAESELRASASRFRGMIEHSYDGITLLGEDGTVRYDSPAITRILGYAQDERVGRKAFEFVHPDEREAFEQRLAGLIRQAGAVMAFQGQFRHKDGSWRRLEAVRVNLLADPSVQAVVVNYRDVTAIVAAEEEIRAANARLLLFRSLVDRSGDAVEVIDPETARFLDINERACRDLGYTREELLSMTVFDIDPTVDRSGFPAAVNALKAAGSMAEQGVHVRKDGSTFPVELHLSYVPLDRDYVVSIARDITQRMEAEASLRTRVAALEAAANAIIITDSSGIIEWVNAAFSQLSGYTAEEAVGRNPRDLVKSGEQDPAAYQDLWQTILGGRAWRGELTNRRKDGTRYHEVQTVTPVKDDSGAITHFIAVKQDLTERDKLQSQFLQAQKMEGVGRLAGGIAHDFNNLLTVINARADLALSAVGQDDPLREEWKEVLGAGQRAAALTRQLLAFSRQQILLPAVVNLNTVVSGIEGMLSRLLGEDVTLETRLAPDLANVKVDVTQAEQVIVNLAVNARDAMPRGGQLTIATRNVAADDVDAHSDGDVAPVGSYVLLSVSDSGVGMDETTRAQLFEPFFTTKEAGRGTGLGLSTVHGIVTQSGGSITVDSAVGRGSVFNIYLPAVPDAVATRTPPSGTVSVSGIETILLAEDDEALLRLVKRILQSAGYAVLASATGEAALQTSERYDKPVHLLLTDTVMPGMGGRKLADALSLTRPAIKVLYMSGYTSDKTLLHGVSETAKNFIAKPFTAPQLLGKVREVLGS